MNRLFRIAPAVISILVSACAVEPAAGNDRITHGPDTLQVVPIARGGCFRLRLEPDERGGLRIPTQIVCPVTGGLTHSER